MVAELVAAKKQRGHKKWGAARRAFYSETRKALANGGIPPLTQEVSELHAQGRPIRDIARELKISESAVQKRIKWAKSKAGVTTFPAAAIPPRRNAPMPARAPRRVVSSASQRAMRVVVKAGSEITVTIGGVEVQIVAEER